MKENTIRLSFGDVRKKCLSTENHFVSHMVEHIAWRMGLSLVLNWQGADWRELGRGLGKEIAKFPALATEGAALGMIDDGSAAVAVMLGAEGVELRGCGEVDREWFLGLRCEQISNGEPLIQLLEGISSGLSCRIEIDIWSLEDTHHTWEGIYRGLGIALGRIFTPKELRAKVTAEMLSDSTVEKFDGAQEICVSEIGFHRATVRRGTAETGITLSLDLLSSAPSVVHIDVDDSIAQATAGFGRLLDLFLSGLGAHARIDFTATELSSSHVVMEDIGLVMGRAALEIVKRRMDRYGVNGVGSNLEVPADIKQKNVQAGISIEGRKFWSLLPADGAFSRMRKEFLIGQTVLGGLRSEDLDDFLDGLSGGMSASIMVHIKDYSQPDQTWQDLFYALGQALREAFSVNPYRRGVPPGVKATLA